MKASRFTATAAGLLFAFIQASTAAPMYFTDRTAFDAATGGSLSFESFEGAFTAGPSFAFAGFTAAESNDGTNNGINVGDFGVASAVTDGNRALLYFDRGPSILTFSSFTPGITAFGFDASSSIASTFTFGGSASDTLAVAANSPTFWGVVDDSGLSSITVQTSATPSNRAFVGFDSVSYGVAESARGVPAPATLALIGLGLLALRLRRRG